MSIKAKFIWSFVVIVVLVAGTTTFTVGGVSKTSKGFSYYDKTSKLVDTALKQFQNPERASMVKSIDKNLKVYKQKFYKVVEFFKQRDEIQELANELNSKLDAFRT